MALDYLDCMFIGIITFIIGIALLFAMGFIYPEWLFGLALICTGLGLVMIATSIIMKITQKETNGIEQERP